MIYGFILKGGGDISDFWIFCEGSEANIFFGFFKTNFGIFLSKRGFCDSPLNFV